MVVYAGSMPFDDPRFWLISTSLAVVILALTYEIWKHTPRR